MSVEALPIRRVETDAEILRCYPLYLELRPHLVEMSIVERVRRQERMHGYTAIYLEEEGRPVALAGYRIAEYLAWGQVLYVDDLVTAADVRGRGCGGTLLDGLLAEGRRSGCDELHLDSGVLRYAAHRLYHARRMEIGSHHFSIRLTA